MYVDIRDIINKGRVFNFIIASRGIGKTYGSLKYCYERYIEAGEKFIYLRRTQTEIDLLLSGKQDLGMNPFKKLNQNEDYDITLGKINKQIGGIYAGEDKKGIGYMLAVSTVSNIRGFDASDCATIVYDEFIPQTNVKKMKDESGAFFNAYETINRNREFDGEKPVLCLILSNSNNLAHPILMETGLINYIEKMTVKGQTFCNIPDKNCTITLFQNEDFYIQKKQTALYQFTKGTHFSDMALDNKFTYNDFSQIASKNISEYNPLCVIKGVCIYRHKSKNEYYASRHIKQCEVFQDTEQGELLFMHKYARRLYGAFVDERIFFETFYIKQILTELLI